MGLLDRLRASRALGVGRAPVDGGQVYSPVQPRFAVIDVETTGLRPDVHRIVEIAVVTTDPWGQVVDEWSTRINPQDRWEPPTFTASQTLMSRRRPCSPTSY
jgi:DNA polymerase-3 subunit epsilon